MFINDFQGGNYFEVFNPSSKDSINNFKITGSHSIQKIYDKEVKGSVFQLDGTPSTTKLTLPKNSRDHLSLIQRCIVFQLFVKSNHEFSVELVVTDLAKNRRNLLFSTSHKELNIQPLSARIPIKCINRDQWTNFVIDLAFLINELWKNQTFKTIDAISMCANCKLRRVFTLKNIPNAEIGLMSEESLVSVDFPEDSNSKTQLFNLNESRSNENVNTAPVNKNSASNLGTKSQNVFNIAFGSKFREQTPISQSRQLKSAKSQPQISNDVNNIKSKKDRNAQLPLQLSSEHLQKSISKNEMSSTYEKKSATKLKSNLDPSNVSSNETKNKDFNSDVSLENSLSKNLNKIESITMEGKTILETNKIPHPPSQPKSSRPTSTSARKIRFNSAVKSSQQKQSLSKEVTNKEMPSATKQMSNGYNGESSNDDDMQNSSKTLVGFSPIKSKALDSSKDESKKTVSNVNKVNSYLNLSNASVNKTEDLVDLIKALKADNHNNKNQINKENVIEMKNSALSQQNNNSNNTKTESNNANQNVSYSFSSRPKPAPFINGNHQNEVAKNNKEAYDHRRYATPTLFKNYDKLYEGSNPQHNKEVIPWKTAIARDSLNEEINSTNPNNFEIMDSFEANMLRELKEEMAFNANSNSNGKNNFQDNNSKKNDSGIDSKSSKVSSTNSNNSNTDIKRDVANEFTIQRDNSGIQSSCSDEYNQTSEKYNFDLITSSIDETTTSLSKKTPSRITKYENNNYQDEMNFSLQIQSKSINLKDLPSKYSPLLSQQNGINSHPHYNPITEEHLDDSQADIDSDSEDEVDLLYDPALDCYYDPKTSTYYALNMD